MNSFEKYSIAVQIITAIAVVLTLIVYFRQLRTMNRQLLAAEGEMGARMRPWIGMFGFGFEASEHPGSSDILCILLKNSGALPAQSAKLSLHLVPELSSPDADSKPIGWVESGEKALVPGEDGNYAISMAPYSQFAEWRRARTNVRVEGTMDYSLEQRAFKSKFLAVLRFNEDPDERGQVKVRWRNVEIL